jgi:Oxidoreductase family, NAD-binding Rossmann fold/Oxidoreductase family, C-terminal alpha/beta domain
MSDSPKTPDAAPAATTRRTFLKEAAAAAAGFTIVPRHVIAGSGATPPSDLLNIAGVGVGGMGRANLVNLSSQNIVALCDVDWDYANKSFEKLDANILQTKGRLDAAKSPADRERMEDQIANSQRLKDVHLPKATKYTDFREMLEKQKDIDGVVVATPDHLHAVIASAAMDLGKHVYVQKPLTWSVAEARHLAKKATEKKVATQMGNQGHSSDDARLINEHIAAGTIGEVREVHVWTNRPLTHWPQGIPRPEKVATETLPWNMSGVMQRLANAMAGDYPAPSQLRWDLFLGPSSQTPYHPVYHPFNWRGWVDWGCGAIGDMGAHLIDHPFWALNLGFPTSIETVSTPYNKATFPMATMTYYEFPARGNMPPVRLTWYDGALLPPRPEELGEEQLDKTGGVLYIGSKGKLIHETYGYNPRLLGSLARTPAPPPTLPRIGMSHELNWVQAAKGNGETSSPFEFASRLTETMLLGVVALKAGTKIHYDGENMRVTNNLAANDFLKREYREGWVLT